jgi:hypothetical protein
LRRSGGIASRYSRSAAARLSTVEAEDLETLERAAELIERIVR